MPLSPALAAALGVPEDADDETALAALAARTTPPAAEPPAPQTPTEGGPTGTAPDVEALVTAAVQKATAPVLAALQTTSTELAELKAKDARSVRDGVIGGAVTAGKIRPADRESWEKRYDAAPDVITDVLASLAPGTAVPVTAAGHTGGEVADLDDEAAALVDGYEQMLRGGR